MLHVACMWLLYSGMVWGSYQSKVGAPPTGCTAEKLQLWQPHRSARSLRRPYAVGLRLRRDA